MISILKNHPLLKIMNTSLINLPSPSNITGWWNFGSLLGLCLMTQTMTGLFLAMHYVSDINYAFESVSHVCRDVNYGWLLRMTHANGASFFFISLYFHIGRGVFFNSYLFIMTWSVGLAILLATMAAAFLGYVLPWGQMSFWGATVITNLFSAIPILGEDIVSWLWGGFAVDKATLTRFFALHFLIPFILMALVMSHLLFLHQSGSNNPLGLLSDTDKVIFHPFFTIKDLVGIWLILMILFTLNMVSPWILGDSENFIPANPLLTPVHIQPEWYYLFAYAILRAIPNKLGGVIALVLAVVILLILPEMHNFKFRGFMFYPISSVVFWSLVSIFLLLTWIGARPVEIPFIMISQVLTLLYFSFYLLVSTMSKMWDFVLK